MKFVSRQLNLVPWQWAGTSAFIALLAVCFGLHGARAQEKQSVPLVLDMQISGEIEPVLATYIEEGLADAARRHATLVLITMDTPGGLSDSTEKIVQHILDSPVPVAVYVAPKGARGASAGFFILLSADVAAMAPATRTGAASPILAIGGFTIGVDETLRRKIMNDAQAFLRSFSEKRGRNLALAETAVTDAKAFTAQEALDGKLIDYIADSPEELLQKLNGREITRFNGTKVKLELANPVRQQFALSMRQSFLARIVEPDAFFLLLIVGALGLYTEFTHPGMVAPGVVGAICMVLALYAMHLLPVNLAGVLLILVGITLFVLEAKYTSHGALLIGGIVAMILGALFLVRSPLTAGGVSLGIAIAVTLPFAGISVFLMRSVLRSRRWKPATGLEEMIGEVGTVVKAVPAAGEGMIRLHGELWRAFSSQAIADGKSVRVIKVEGLRVQVAPTEASGNTRN
ncbi:MAG TPA: nodulation protein NfeD [Candidatus Dormibacteraeota bacterium]|nr:nodulation protein NfeD [Candidatus Dormibacteraeota bacterium]